MKDKLINWPAWVSIILTLFGLTVGAAVWAGSEHSQIREIGNKECKSMVIEAENRTKENYVPLYRFTVVEEKLDSQSKQIGLVDEKLDKIIERLHKTVN